MRHLLLVLTVVMGAAPAAEAQTSRCPGYSETQVRQAWSCAQSAFTHGGAMSRRLDSLVAGVPTGSHAECGGGILGAACSSYIDHATTDSEDFDSFRRNIRSFADSTVVLANAPTLSASYLSRSPEEVLREIQHQSGVLSRVRSGASALRSFLASHDTGLSPAEQNRLKSELRSVYTSSRAAATCFENLERHYACVAADAGRVASAEAKRAEARSRRATARRRERDRQRRDACRQLELRGLMSKGTETESGSTGDALLDSAMDKMDTVHAADDTIEVLRLRELCNGATGTRSTARSRARRGGGAEEPPAAAPDLDHALDRLDTQGDFDMVVDPPGGAPAY